MKKILQGRAAEEAACAHLRKFGLKLLGRNFQCVLGEIDLIMRDKEVLVFVEVRYRVSSSHGSGAESVNWAKQRKIIKTASYYLQSKKQLLDEIAIRFDVVSLSSDMQNKWEIDWIKSAFEA